MVSTGWSASVFVLFAQVIAELHNCPIVYAAAVGTCTTVYSFTSCRWGGFSLKSDHDANRLSHPDISRYGLCFCVNLADILLKTAD